MSFGHIFGYGSLVNLRTHAHDGPEPATLDGWRRCWRHVEGRSVAFLTAVRAGGARIDGLVARVPSQAFPELDQREKSYIREAVRLDSGTAARQVQMYHAPVDLHRPVDHFHPILLSYIDVVVQGYLEAFGEDGVARFFDTTDGWDAPILNDRTAPRYPRHQQLSAGETALVDAELARVSARIVQPSGGGETAA